MQSKKRPAPDVAASKRAGKESELQTLSRGKLSTRARRQSSVIHVSGFLGHGVESRKLSGEIIGNIEAATGVRLSRQEMQQIIRRERLAGVPILSLAGRHPGYFLPSEDSEQGKREAVACLAMLCHMSHEVDETYKALCDSVRRRFDMGGGDEE